MKRYISTLLLVLFIGLSQVAGAQCVSIESARFCPLDSEWDLQAEWARDLWRQKDIPTAAEYLIPSHLY